MDDLISRQEALKAVGVNSWAGFRINALPSAQRTGRWMFTDAAPHRVYCSECYKTFIPNKEWYAWAEHIVPRKYCPNCGAQMEVEE